jgi:hypothetical protein
MAGLVNVLVFSNFEGFMPLENAQSAVDWFNGATKAHPEIRWTHLFTPRYLLADGNDRTGRKVLLQHFQDLQSSNSGEVGLHLHLYTDMVSDMGVEPINAPSGRDDSLKCDRGDGTDGPGYGVLMTGYSTADRSAILDAAIKAFEDQGLLRPTTFCAGYSATDPSLQAMLAAKGFSVSFAAQPLSRSVPPQFNYSRCWHKLLDWSGHITPRTVPYRVNRNSILPPPHDKPEFLDLVEVPLNMWVDALDLFDGDQSVSREDMFDCHYDWARDNDGATAVAIGVHADVVAGEKWGSGPISKVIDEFLSHVSKRSSEGDTEVVFATAAEVVDRFLKNTTISEVSCGKN